VVGDEAVTDTIAIGVGCRKGCGADAIESLVLQALGRAPAQALLGLFTLIDKQGESGLTEAAARLGFPITYLDRRSLLDQADKVQTLSARAEELFGVPSVAEAAALAGAGPSSILIVRRIADGGATCAIARAAS
jgi:cobalt-precorrin 5A hydrolase